jgi:hypothetical protein
MAIFVGKSREHADRGNLVAFRLVGNGAPRAWGGCPSDLTTATIVSRF